MTDLPHNDVLIFVRFLNNGPHLYDILEAFRDVDQAYLGRKLKMFKDPPDQYVQPCTPSYVQTLIRFWSYLDSKNKARLWTYIARRDAERNGPSHEDMEGVFLDDTLGAFEGPPLIKKVEELKARIDTINARFQPQQTTLF